MHRGYLLRLILVISVILLASILGCSFARFYGILPRTMIKIGSDLNLTEKAESPILLMEEPSLTIPCVNWIEIKEILTTSKFPLSKDYSMLDLEGKLKDKFKQGDAIWIYFRYEFSLSEDKIKHLRFNQYESSALGSEHIVYIRTQNETILLAKISVNLSLVDLNGNIRIKSGSSQGLTSCLMGISSGRKWDGFYVFGGRVPFSCEPGRYQILVSVKDELSGNMDEMRVNITIVEGEYKEPRFSPIPTAPEALVLTDKELPGGWKEVYSLNNSFWSPYYEQQIRFVIKQFVRGEVGKKALEIEITSFETPEGALAMYEDRYYWFNRSDPHASSDRISSFPGVRSFVVVRYEPLTGLRSFSVYSLIGNVVIRVTGGIYVKGIPTPAPLMEEILDIAEMQELRVISSES